MPGYWKKIFLGILKPGFAFQEQILADRRNRAYHAVDPRMEEDSALWGCKSIFPPNKNPF